MKPLMYWQGNLLEQWPAAAWRVGASLLAACVASAVWAEPLGNNNFSRLIRANPSGHFELKENVYLNGSPWTPFPPFNGILEGSEYAIYGLNIEENRTNANSGLFLDQSGTIRDLVFVHPEAVARGNGVYLGLVAGENSGNVTGIFWQGGWMEHTGARARTRSRDRQPLMGVVGRNLAGGQVEAWARGVTQTATGDFALIGIGAGWNSDSGIAQGVAQAVIQTATGNYTNMGIGAGWNSDSAIAQGVAQAVNQTTTGYSVGIGIGAGWNSDSGIAQGMAQSVNQTATSDLASIGVGVGYNRGGTAQAVAQSVNQTVTGYSVGIGIGAGWNSDSGIAQGMAQSVTQTATGGFADIGIGAGRNWLGIAQGVAQAVIQTGGKSASIGIGAGRNTDTAQGVARAVTQTGGNSASIGTGAGRNTGIAQGKRLTEADKARNLDDLGLTARPGNWTTGNTTQYPMLVDLNGGYQDMKQLSPIFEQAMRDYASPLNNPDASWFSPEIRTILKRLSVPCGDFYCLFTVPSPGTIRHLLYDGQRYQGFVRTHDGLTYWAVYEKDGSRVSREPCCDLYGFTNLNEKGVVVDAVASGDDAFHVAYHAPGQGGSLLAQYEVSDLEPQPQMSMMPLPARPVELFVHDKVLYLVSADQVVQVDGVTVFSAMGGEAIRSARIVGEILYVLLDADGDLQIRATYLANSEPNTGFTIIPKSVAGSQVVALRAGNERIHLLAQEGNQIRWLKYSLQGEKDNESLATLTGRVSLSHLDLILEPIPGTQMFQEKVIAMGASRNNQPWWSVISFETMQPTSSTESSGLSAGALAGISIGVTAAVISTTAVATGLVSYLTRRTREAGWERLARE